MAMTKDETPKNTTPPVGVVEMWGPTVGKDSVDNILDDVDNIGEVAGGWFRSNSVIDMRLLHGTTCVTVT